VITGGVGTDVLRGGAGNDVRLVELVNIGMHDPTPDCGALRRARIKICDSRCIPSRDTSANEKHCNLNWPPGDIV
jgi:hypothetical protein